MYYSLSHSGGGGSFDDKDIKTLWGVFIVITAFMLLYLMIELGIWVFKKATKSKIKYLHDYVFFTIWSFMTGLIDLCVLVWWLGLLIGKQL
jgi:hypothetical protein